MSTIDKDFERELELFRTECESAAQFFFGYLAIHEVAKRRLAVFRLLNENALFWNTVSGAMQTAAVIAIGRIFDQGSAHNVDRLLKLAQRYPLMFSKTSLAQRKQGDEPKPPAWLDKYVRDAYVPSPSDFRRLRSHVAKQRRIYDASYRDLRRKVYAHREVVDAAEIELLVSKTSLRELERLLLFLLRMYEALWHLLMNGRKPTLRRLRYSVSQDGTLSLPRISASGVHRRMVREVEQVLMRTAGRQLARGISRASRRPHQLTD